MPYHAPVRDLRFALETAEFDALAKHFPNADTETVTAVLEAAGSLASEVLAPLNRAGDIEGARFENGQVIAAPGFAGAYKEFAKGGWNGLSADPAWGGQGLPRALEVAVFEMIQGANMAFGLCPMLTLAAIESLSLTGSDAQKALYLPKLVSGEWTGTMNLTEPQSGSDLGGIASRAESDGNGGWRLTGQKIFITWGDHDVADNIVHMVLARLPDSPPGTRGLTLFLAPKRLVGADGSLGEANDVRPVSIEHKLGIHGSPTCVMAYEGARAEMVGAPNAGMPICS
jgi:alkylation response protein AidB-like acyl-CoA dehydrogenase